MWYVNKKGLSSRVGALVFRVRSYSDGVMFRVRSYSDGVMFRVS